MRRGAGALFGVLFAGLAAAAVVFVVVQDRSSPINWLRSEFSLSDSQARKVEQIHADYEEDCAQMCARIAQTDERLANLIRSSKQITPEIQAAIVETDRLRSECRAKMLEHFYRIAAQLPAEKQSDYLTVVLPSVLHPGEMMKSHLR
ncbi:MAG TPA: periplasmic heavy metal sensor [Terrimicrobiaceae bacterium]|jgi:septal ring factor EnvC (AmiA/AmiB activator)|nr:periplasmic heavy metal sensor [Terrimicrobiaceae bacterium]